MRCAPTSATRACGRTATGALRLSHPRLAQQYRMNAGTIVEAPMIKVRLVGRRRPGASRAPPRPLMGGRVLGELEEYFIEQLQAGDTFVFAGEVLRFEGMQDTDAFVTRTTDPDPTIPSYEGGKFPLSTHLAERVRAMMADPERWRRCRTPVCEWLSHPGRALRDPRRRRGAGRDLPARPAAFPGGLSVRRAAGAPDARHAADAPAGPRRRQARRLRRQRLRAGGVGASATLRRAWRATAGSTSPSCSPKTCWATTSMPGSPSRA